MLLEELSIGWWTLEVPGDENAGIRLRFRDGRVFEDGVEIGSYGADGHLVRARIGNDMEFAIEEAVGNSKPFTRIAQGRSNGEDRLQFGHLVRVN